MKYHRSGWGKTSKFSIAYILLFSLLFSSIQAVTAQEILSGDRSQGNTLVVTNASEVINGDYSSPTALIGDPGQDGISLPEAILATNNTSDFYSVTFDPNLSSSTISLSHDMPHISQGNITINGDINDDGTPDITIDGSNANFNCFNITGASNVVIRGFNMHNFPKHGVNVSPDSGSGKPDMENITLYQNDITSTEANISLTIYGQPNCSISDVEINANGLHNGTGAISVLAGMGSNAVNNRITNLTILNNSIDNPAPSIDIFISPAADSDLSGNTISDIEIRGNHITGQNDSSIIVDASNQSNCSNNTLEGLLISDNYIEGIAVGIELVGESGSYSTGNLMTDVTISDNTLIGCGIHVAGSTGNNAHGNTMSYLTFERNFLNAAGVSGTANGIYLAAGADGAYENILSDLVIRDNFINGFADAGILLHGNDSNSPNNSIDRVTILNQTITNNALGNTWASGINVNTRHSSNTITNVSIKNSILWGNGGGDSIKGSITPEIVTNTILNDVRFTGNDGNFYSDPKFVDSSSGDYHLQSISPCVDSGDPYTSSEGFEDLDLNERVVDGDGDVSPVIDLGAWEFNASAVQEISILGNGESIFNDDSVPATWDETDFGSVAIGQAPVQHTFTIENQGDSSLELTGISPVEITGANPGDFSVVTQPATSINGAQTVTFTIKFDPTAAGLREATVRILNNDNDESEFIFAIQGLGDEPPTPQEIVVLGNGEEIPNGDSSPAVLNDTDFGNAEIGGISVEHTFTIQNAGETTLTLTGSPLVEIIGEHTGDFSVVTQPGASIAGGQSTTFTVAFDPAATGQRKASILISNNDADEAEFSFAIQGVGEEPPTPQEISVQGNGNDILNGDSSPSTSDNTGFGNAEVGGAVQHSFTIQNTGETTLTLTGSVPVAIIGEHASDFSVITQPSASIEGGQSSSFTVEFSPAFLGQRGASIQILNNDSDESAFTFAIQGYGAEPPEIAVSGNGLSILDGDNTPSTSDGTDFGNAVIGGDTVQSTFTIENLGENQLELTGTSLVEITGTNAADFSVVTQPADFINGGESTTFTIAFSPSGLGHHGATVHIPNNDADEDGFNFYIQGNGEEPPAEREISVLGNGDEIFDGDNTPSTLDGTDFGNAEVSGDSIQHTFTIRNTGGTSLELTGVTPVELTGANASDFIVTVQPDVVINGGQSTTFTISFTPSGLGPHEATVHIANNDADEGGFNFVIQGNGVESSGEDFNTFIPLFLNLSN